MRLNLKNKQTKKPPPC